MNELELLRELDDVHLPELGELEGARARLMSAIAREPGHRRGRVWAGLPSFQGRRSRSTGVAVALAAIPIALVIVTGASHHARTTPAANGGSRAATHSPPSATADVTAVQVLHRAAFVSLGRVSEAPSADQFVYTKTETADGKVTQSWLSVDGKRTSIVGGLTVFGCVNGRLAVRSVDIGGSRLCSPSPAYFPEMPTQPDQMLEYLEKTHGVRLTNLNDLAKAIGAMLDYDYILPAQQAALYEFLARTPGLQVQTNVMDSAGRRGVGVGWSFEGTRAILIFDPRTYEYLGTATEGIHGEMSGDALLRKAIVDRAGRVPPPPQSPTA